MDKIDERLIVDKTKQFMLDFILELNNAGYTIQTSRIIAVFKMLGSFDAFNEEEMIGILQSLLCQNETEYKEFPKAFRMYFCSDKKEVDKEKSLLRIEKLKNDIEEGNKESIKKIEEKGQDIRNSYADIAMDIKGIIDEINLKTNKGTFSAICLGDRNALVAATSSRERGVELEDDLQTMMLYAIKKNFSTRHISYILEIAEMAKYAREAIGKNSAWHKEKEIKKLEKIIQKDTSVNHRQIYTEGKNAVQTKGGYLYKDITKLTDQDLDRIAEFVKMRAASLRKKFKTRNKSRELDYKKTIKAAAKTGMIPMELIYKNRIKKRTKIVCITDISGSCKKASQVLFTFMYALQEAFPGGVESYVFVKQLRDATQIFRTYPLSEANTRASMLVERDYSDYGRAFDEFDRMYLERLTKDTILIFLGDARNNMNEIGESFLKKAKQKTNYMYWLNPEPEEKWDTGDSVISQYRQYMDGVKEIKNTKDIISFLESISSKCRLY